MVLKTVARSTLANENRDKSYQIWGEMFYSLYEHCKKLTPGNKFKIKMSFFTLGTTTISLYLSQFPCAQCRKRKEGIKLHTFLKYDGCLPCYVSMSEGKCHDVRLAKNPENGLPKLHPDSILTIDRGHIHFSWLYSLHCNGTTFIIRSKSNMNYDNLEHIKNYLEIEKIWQTR